MFVELTYSIVLHSAFKFFYLRNGTHEHLPYLDHWWYTIYFRWCSLRVGVFVRLHIVILLLVKRASLSVKTSPALTKLSCGCSYHGIILVYNMRARWAICKMVALLIGAINTAQPPPFAPVDTIVKLMCSFLGDGDICVISFYTLSPRFRFAVS